MLASVPILSGTTLVPTAKSAPAIGGEFKNEYFPKLGITEKKKGAFPGLAKGNTHSLKNLEPAGSFGSIPLPHYNVTKSQSNVPEDNSKKNDVIGAFAHRSKSGNLAKFEQAALLDKGGSESELKLPVLTPAPSKAPTKTPHRLGHVKPQKYERLEAFKIYKNARKSATLDRLKILGCQGRPNTPSDTPVSRPVSRINLPPVNTDASLDVTNSFPARPYALSKTPENALPEKPTRARDIELSPNGEEIDTHPSLKVMNMEPEIIPDELKATPSRSPDFHPSARSWNPSNTDKPRNILRPTGGYGRYRASVVFDTSPVGGAVHAGRIPKSLLAPSQGNTTLLRFNYAKNLEKNWLKRMHEENTRKKKEKTAKDWLIERCHGRPFNFETCFYSSESDEDVAAELESMCDSEAPFTPRLVRGSSIDVLNSDVEVESEDETEDISIILRDGQLKDKVVRNKMRKKHQRRRQKYRDIIKVSRELEIAEKVAASISHHAQSSNKDFDPEYIGGIDGLEGEKDIDLAIDEMRYFTETPSSPPPLVPIPRELDSLTDKEIRAMRLKLKAKTPAVTDPIDYGDPAQIRKLTEELLASFNKNNKDKKGKKKKKVKRSEISSGKKVKWNKKPPDYNEYERSSPVKVSCKDQFIQDFGHWLDERIESRLRREQTESQAGETMESSPQLSVTITDPESPELSEEIIERPRSPCATELALREFTDDYSLLTDILLDTRRPVERFMQQNRPKQPIEAEKDDFTDTPRMATNNVLLAGMVGVQEPKTKANSYEDLVIPAVRRQSDPGLERLKQIKFTVPLPKQRSSSRRGKRRRSSTSTVSSRLSRRSSIKSITSEASEKQANFKQRRPQTPGVYRIRRRMSKSRISSGKSNISDDAVSIKSDSSTKSKRSFSSKKGRRSKQAKPSRSHQSSPEKRTSSSKQSRRLSRRLSRLDKAGLDSIPSSNSGTFISEGSNREESLSRPTSANSNASSLFMDVEEVIIDLDEMEPRPSSARRLNPVEPEIDLWDLTKGLDFPAKEVKIKIVNRKRRRQRKKKLMKIQAEVRGLQRANKLAETILSGQHQDSKAGDGLDESDISSSSDESEEEQAAPEPLKPMTFALDSPFVSACLAWKTSSRMRLKLTNEELDKQIANLSPLFKEMIECRYIRWSARDWAIIERLYELELLES